MDHGSWMIAHGLWLMCHYVHIAPKKGLYVIVIQSGTAKRFFIVFIFHILKENRVKLTCFGPESRRCGPSRIAQLRKHIDVKTCSSQRGDSKYEFLRKHNFEHMDERDKLSL